MVRKDPTPCIAFDSTPFCCNAAIGGNSNENSIFYWYDYILMHSN